jgi:hypothetical protein
MALNGDPYRILGLPAGAPLAEVKRAYRRLAKANHPDTAGEAAIPRFLAIQAAYEALVGDDGRGRRRPGAARTSPWQADPDRSRATREAWRSRGARAGRRPGSEASGSGPAAGTEPGSGGRRRAATGGRRAGPDRQPGRATPGSTSYDFAEHEPYDPHWSGASWYGQSSGTYWTINPKEYADPRKHGPEYQARGRRRPMADADAAGAETADFRAETADEPIGETAAGPTGPGEPATGPDRRRRAAPPPPPPAPPSSDAPPAPGHDPLASLPWTSGVGGRVALALVGWPPIGLALALAIGEVSGCGRFAATCVETFSIGGWLGQLAVIAVLLLVPALAGIAAAGSIAVLAASVPAAVVLSAAGGSRRPDAAGGLLLVLLAVAWLAGAGFAVARRSRTLTR